MGRAVNGDFRIGGGVSGDRGPMVGIDAWFATILWVHKNKPKITKKHYKRDVYGLLLYCV